MESRREIHGHVIIPSLTAEMREFEVEQWPCGVVFSESDILDVNIKHRIPVFLDKCQIHWIAKYDGAGGIPGDWRHFECDVCVRNVLLRFRFNT